jgi:hypothetical protein
MTLERGDLQFVHNHTLLHDRTAFDDFPEPARRRYLLRLWLAPRVTATPARVRAASGNVAPGVRGGVGVSMTPDAFAGGGRMGNRSSLTRKWHVGARRQKRASQALVFSRTRRGLNRAPVVRLRLGGAAGRRSVHPVR